MVALKDYQRQSLSKDIRSSLIIIAILAFTYAFSVLRMQLSVGELLTSFLVFLVLISIYIFFSSSTLVKILQKYVDDKPTTIWYFPFSLWIIASLYTVLTGPFAFFILGIGLIYCLLPVFLMQFLRGKEKKFLPIDAAIILLLWLPIEFGLIPSASLPPNGGIAVYHLVGLLLLFYDYLVIRQLPDVGYTYNLKHKEWQTAIINFLIVCMVILVLGMAVNFIRFSDDSLDLGFMVSSLVTILFFVAIPEELLFRGVIHNLIQRRMNGIKNAETKALVISSIIFGLAHGNNSNAPFLDISLGSLGVWHMPWAYILLATIAGYAYGLTYVKTKKIMAAAIVHLLIDWVWVVFFSG